MTLSLASLGSVAVQPPPYDPAGIAPGILHFGPGAFHRAHQADFIDRLLASDPRWGIVAVSLRSAGVTDALAAQQGLYTLTIRDAVPARRVIGAVRGWLGPGREDDVAHWLADPRIRLVSATVTEKGYCLDAEGRLDWSHPDIVHDLGAGQRPRSLVGWLALGLAVRRAAGVAPFAVLPCDNLPENGRRLAVAVIAFAARRDADLAAWIAGEARFANTMVDAITPASDDRLRAEATAFGDAVPVQREAFAQWVVEDVLPKHGPDLAAVGVAVSNDVAAFERMKLRILNGAHSSLAYLGLLRGRSSVAEAMADPALAEFVRALVVRDITACVGAPAGFDLSGYVESVFRRFGNPAIVHRLDQIAIDGSKKLPYRLIATLGIAARQGRPLHRLLLPIAGWMRWLQQQASAADVADPLAATLWAAARAETEAVPAFLAMPFLFDADTAAMPMVRAALATAWASTADRQSLEAALRRFTDDTGFL